MEMDRMHTGSPDGHELPPRPRRKTVVELWQEKERDAWYWRAMAQAASALIMFGFLLFGGAFMVQDNERASSQIVPVTVVALILVNTGYIVSVALWFLRRNWVFQLDCIFVPCLTSSAFGLLNSIIVPKLVLATPELTAPALASLLVSLVSTVVYGGLSAFTRLRIRRLEQLAARPQSEGLVYVSDEELQRRQMSALLAKKDQVTAATLASQRTYHINMPIPQSKKDRFYDPAVTMNPSREPPAYSYYT